MELNNNTFFSDSGNWKLDRKFKYQVASCFHISPFKTISHPTLSSILDCLWKQDLIYIYLHCWKHQFERTLNRSRSRTLIYYFSCLRERFNLSSLQFCIFLKNISYLQNILNLPWGELFPPSKRTLSSPRSQQRCSILICFVLTGSLTKIFDWGIHS